MESRPAIIQVVDLKKVYGSGEAEVTALNGINLTISSGEFVAIMGPSGSGKSTLLNILACLDRPTQGKYILAGEDISSYSRRALALLRGRQLGFIFQSYNLLPRATALENVIMPMMYRRLDRVDIRERRDRAMTSLESVGLADRAHHFPNQLSGGQQQRVAIARALINEPILVLADEPTGNLDTHSSQEIIELLHDLNTRGRTIVMVTHEPDIAHYAGRILLIRDGMLASDRKNGQPGPKRPVMAASQPPGEHMEIQLDGGLP